MESRLGVLRLAGNLRHAIIRHRGGGLGVFALQGYYFAAFEQHIEMLSHRLDEYGIRMPLLADCDA